MFLISNLVRRNVLICLRKTRNRPAHQCNIHNTRNDLTCTTSHCSATNTLLTCSVLKTLKCFCPWLGWVQLSNRNYLWIMTTIRRFTEVHITHTGSLRWLFSGQWRSRFFFYDLKNTQGSNMSEEWRQRSGVVTAWGKCKFSSWFNFYHLTSMV